MPVIQISPSQLKTKRACFRKWGFQKIDGLEDSPGRGAILGTAAHALTAEHYSGRPFAHMRDEELVEIHSEAPKVRRLADALIAHYGDVPNPIIEEHLKVPRDGYMLHGYADLIYTEPPTRFHERPRVVVCDHKTSKNPERYAMTTDGRPAPMHVREENLRQDEQAIVYGAWALNHFEVEEVDLQWVYVATQGQARTIPIRATVDRAHVERHLEIIDVDAREIVRARKEVKSAVDLPYNTRSCGDYGGCPFAERCPRSLDDRLGAIYEETDKDMGSLRDLIKQNEAANNGGGKGKGKKAPPRPEELGPGVNAPESPQDPETQRDMSVAAGPGRDAQRTVAETVAQGGTAAEGGEQAGRDQAARKSPTKDEILQLLVDGPVTFTKKQNKATEGAPFAHGRTLNSLVKEGLITIFEDTPTSRGVELTVKGCEKMGVEEKGAAVEEPITADDVDDAPAMPPPMEEITADDFDDDGFSEVENDGLAEAICVLVKSNNPEEAKILAQRLVERL